MLHHLLRSTLIAAALVAGSSFLAATTPTASAQQGLAPSYYGNPDLFYNFYAQANGGGIGAQMYLSPGPVPAHVGHTYYTYQPFMPHELLYKHHRTYHRYYDEGRGFTRTHVRWW